MRQRINTPWYSKVAPVVIVALGLFPVAPAQTLGNSVIDGPVPASVKPGSPATAYPLEGFDTVNLYNGKVNVAIPLLKIGGRGESGYTMMLALTQPAFHAETTASISGSCEGSCFQYTVFSAGVLSYWTDYTAGYGPGLLVVKRSYQGATLCGSSGPYFANSTFTALVFLEPDGSETELYSNGTNGRLASSWTCSDQTTGVVTRGNTFTSIDGSGLTFTAATGGQLEDLVDVNNYPDGSAVQLAPSGTLYFPHGRRYVIANGLVTTIYDPNNNKTSFLYTSSNSGGGVAATTTYVSTITDPLGRQTTISYNPDTTNS